MLRYMNFDCHVVFTNIIPLHAVKTPGNVSFGRGGGGLKPLVRSWSPQIHAASGADGIVTKSNQSRTS